MKIVISFLLFTILSGHCVAQKIFEHYTKLTDSLRYGYGKNDFLQYNDKGYTLILPDTSKKLIGVIISLDDEKYNIQDTSKQRLIYPHANEKGFAVLYISTGIPV